LKNEIPSLSDLNLRQVAGEQFARAVELIVQDINNSLRLLCLPLSIKGTNRGIISVLCYSQNKQVANCEENPVGSVFLLEQMKILFMSEMPIDFTFLSTLKIKGET